MRAKVERLRSTPALVTLVLAAFAGNSILARAALTTPAIDALSFATLRVLSGAIALSLLVMRGQKSASAPQLRTSSQAIPLSGSIWLWLYAFPFAWAYLELSAGTGALILFGAVQATMIGAGLLSGERPPPMKWLGIGIALGGLFYLFLPGATAPPPLPAAVMTVSGVSWGMYSLKGRRSEQPLSETATHFMRASLIGLVCVIVTALFSSLGAFEGRVPAFVLSPVGIVLAVTSGAITSGCGYALWYRVLPKLAATTAASVQLTVPVIAALGGVLLIEESLTVRLVITSVLILGGVFLAIYASGRASRPAR